MRGASLLVLLVLGSPAWAGLYYSGETIRELPAQWRGYLPDQRALRLMGAAGGVAASPLRDQYADTALRLDALSKTRPLTADEAADLGALYLRLGQPDRAVGVLRPAALAHPEHFRLSANLGTAWQAVGNLPQALVALDEAVRLAPKDLKRAETFHRNLVRLRQQEGRSPADAPDDLFGIRFVGEQGTPVAGSIAPAQRKLLPADDLAIAQQLAIWLPGDGRLLWLLAELANAHGDPRMAANLLDGCVGEFGLASPELRARRTLYRTAADDLERKEGHKLDRGDIRFRSPRALLRGFDIRRLPMIQPDGINPLPWGAIGETEFAANGRPTFLKYIDDLDGKKVRLVGNMAPSGAKTTELTEFLLTEAPIGCWFCETPGPSQVVFIELAAGMTVEPIKGTIKLTGVLKLNRTDPELYPLILTDARISVAD